MEPTVPSDGPTSSAAPHRAAASAGAGASTVTAPDEPSPHSTRNKIGRVLWGVVHALLFRPSPRIAYRWRIMLLNLFGAKVHPTAHILPSVRVWAPWNLTVGAVATIGENVDVYSVAPITLGDRCAVSQYTYLCAATHDHLDPRLPLVPKPITLGNDVWIAADVFVAPGVTVGEGTVVGARSSVFADLPPWVVAVGTPAKPIKKRELRDAAARP